MPKTIYLIEGEAFPSMAKGFVVSRNKAGSECTWSTLGNYSRTNAAPYPISECDWDAAIAQAGRRAKTQAETLYVVRG